jgi:AcrR family transcriptional regulator
MMRPPSTAALRFVCTAPPSIGSSYTAKLGIGPRPFLRNRTARYPCPVETLPGYLQRLPAEGDRFQAEIMSRDQRGRILAAIAEVVAKRGYQSTTVEHIVKRAGVARATFYENFGNREDCLLACFSEAEEEARRRILAATELEQDWPEKVRVGVGAYLDYVVSDPALARTAIVESMAAGPAAMQRYEQALQSFTPLFRYGRNFAPPDRELPETLEDSIVGGIVWMIHQRLLGGEVDQIAGLLPVMLEFALAPYLGEQRAAQIAAKA